MLRSAINLAGSNQPAKEIPRGNNYEMQFTQTYFIMIATQAKSIL